MIKVMGCLLILAASTAGGIIYGEGFKKRVKQLNELERAINQLQNEIEYTYTPLPEALYNVSKKSENPISDIFMKASNLLYSNEVETVHEAFIRCFNDKDIALNINKEDINIILDLSKSLGESDLEGHKKIFSLFISNLKKRISSAEIEMNKNVKMYRYLGFSIGAMIVIVLV
ncbi:stage III sporulation protein SpoIIIAB [Clostridium sp. SYSU_GA19001]|uniref:stage III sporulation protein SpoIIIAB n=1 Tax=Clostridium caldaquaticum TaxID=2940653 RepID=UPI00207793C0|nr:stage III sporulation protein SpoIIIAB [Clostridium caldaquaticum]MCM8711037.1 stage III sporulation protein SpoIIIAB [Clostridium caldaquaticum]